MFPISPESGQIASAGPPRDIKREAKILVFVNDNNSYK